MGGTVDQFVETEKCRVVNPREPRAARGIALRNPVQPPEYKPNPNRGTRSLSPSLPLSIHTLSPTLATILSVALSPIVTVCLQHNQCC